MMQIYTKRVTLRQPELRGGGGVVGCRCWVNIKDLTGLISQHGIGTEYLSKNRLFFPLLRYTNWALSCPEMTQKGVTWLNYGKKNVTNAEAGVRTCRWPLWLLPNLIKHLFLDIHASQRSIATWGLGYPHYVFNLQWWICFIAFGAFN